MKVYVKTLPQSCMKCFACQCINIYQPTFKCAIIGEKLLYPYFLRVRYKKCPLVKLTPYIIEGEKRWIDKAPTTNHKNTWTIREIK